MQYISGASGNTSKCFGNLGCLEISENWYGMNRPINVLPQERDVINTQFILRTKDTIHSVSIGFSVIFFNYRIRKKFLISCFQQTYSNMSFFQPKFLNTSQPSTIYQSAFDGSRKTVLIVHGFIDTGFVHWVRVSGRYLPKHFQI